MIKYILVSLVLFSQIRGKEYVEVSREENYKVLTYYKEQKISSGSKTLRLSKIEKYKDYDEDVYLLKFVHEFKYETDFSVQLVNKKEYYSNGKLYKEKKLEINREDGLLYVHYKQTSEEGDVTINKFKFNPRFKNDWRYNNI